MVSTRRHQYNQTSQETKGVSKSKPEIKPKISEDEDELTNKLKTLYEDIRSTPSFSAKIDAFLRSNELHSKYRRIVKKKFPRRRIITRFPFELFQADLIEYPKYKYNNKHFVYCLVVIDCFTKYVWIRPMKTKSGEETAQAFDSILREFDEM